MTFDVLESSEGFKIRSRFLRSFVLSETVLNFVTWKATFMHVGQRQHWRRLSEFGSHNMAHFTKR